MRALLTCACDQPRTTLVEVCVVGLECAVISGTIAGCVVDDSMDRPCSDVGYCWLFVKAFRDAHYDFASSVSDSSQKL